MDFWLNDDQRDLQQGIRSFLEGRFDLEEIAAREETDAVIDPAAWTELAEMGVFSLLRDGFDVRAGVVAYEELGRALVPGPVVTTHLACDLIDGAGDGTTIVGHFEPDEALAVVEHASQCDQLLWIRRNGTSHEVCAVDPSALTLTPANRSLDALSPVASTAETSPDATVLATGDDADALALRGALLTAAMSVGVGAAATDLANAYAKEREQFGRPIGSFQAVKHLLAEMLAKVEVARSAVHSAACALDDAADDDPRRAVAVAKVMAGDAALFCGKTGIQIHGGMGFTWEVHAQRYWKRAVVLDASFGTGDDYAELVADTLA